MEKLLTNPLFRNSRRYPSLLRYVVEHALAGETSQLKERTLGVEVFGRDPHYDTNLDPVVRTTAGEIRKRIAQYYHEGGHEHEIRIDLPSGSYVPEFHLPISRIAAVAPPPRTRSTVLYWTPVPVLVGVLLLILWIQPWNSRPLDQFWAPLLNSSNPVLLCIAPANISVVTPDHPGDASGLSLEEVQRLESQHVAVSDATTMSRLAGILQSHAKPYHIRNAAFTNFRELRDGPVILIGAFNNPWTLRLTSPLRYTFARDRESHLSWISDRENPSKRDWVVPGLGAVAQLTEDYGILARMWDPTTEEFVVVAAGIGIYGTTAAGEFLSDATYLKALAQQSPKDWSRKNIEVVIATKVINGVSGPPRILASYVW